jgi:tetraacyldisaccharide 4'-kinase
MPPPPTPEFWAARGLLSTLLQPLAWTYALGTAARNVAARPWPAPVPVICVGNLVLGGAGKTPVTLALAQKLRAEGRAVHILSRGYGGRLAGPVAVDPARHDAAAVGDEPLLLADVAPCWVARDRIAGAKAAINAGAEMLLLDDGLQNPSLAKSLSLAVIDGGYGLGNGRVVPAGPLREPAAVGLARADAFVLMGEDETALAPALVDRPLLRARLRAENAGAYSGAAVVAFAGIARPAKFFATLESVGARIVERHAFGDHHPYTVAELEALRRLRDAHAGARLVTTAKDFVRLPAAWRDAVEVLAVAVAWEDEAALDRVIERARHG